MGIFDFIFGKSKSNIKMDDWQEVGAFRALFTNFGNNIYKSEIVKSCLRPIVEHTSKANVNCKDERIQKILNNRPNVYMNSKDFLAKIRLKLEIYNTVFIYINKDEKGKAVSFYPVPYERFVAKEYANQLFIHFYFKNGENTILAWEDLVVLRKDYNESDIVGDDNLELLKTLELIHTTNQGISNAVKATANLRGILKSTKAMLADEDIREQKERFVRDYLNLENEGGIASLDATQEFTPITMSPTIANYMQMKEFRENVYRYFGINDNIITSDYNESQLEAFYQSRIEPFLIALSVELTNKVFTNTQQEMGFQIIYESNRLQFASNETKLKMVQMVDRGAMTPNEWRMMFNLSPLEGGDNPIRRLDTAVVEEKKGEEVKE